MSWFMNRSIGVKMMSVVGLVVMTSLGSVLFATFQLGDASQIQDTVYKEGVVALNSVNQMTLAYTYDRVEGRMLLTTPAAELPQAVQAMAEHTEQRRALLESYRPHASSPEAFAAFQRAAESYWAARAAMADMLLAGDRDGAVTFANSEVNAAARAVSDVLSSESTLAEERMGQLDDKGASLASQARVVIWLVAGLGSLVAIAASIAVLRATKRALAEVGRAAGESAHGSEETSAQAGAVAAAAEHVSQHVATVAAGAETIDTSIAEIAGSVVSAMTMVAEARQAVESANEQVARLDVSSQEIGAVVQTITSIAEQTNLLALNATIEAARAGDAGRGFSVVAGEVKDLARETAGATENIAHRIEAIRADTSGAVEAIGSIGAVIEELTSFGATIAAAVEEQTATTSEMSRNLAEAATGSGHIAESIASVAEIVASSTGQAQTVALVAQEISEGRAPEGRLAPYARSSRSSLSSSAVSPRGADWPLDLSSRRAARPRND